MRTDQRTYYRHRAMIETEMADSAGCPEAALVHRVMAESYALIADDFPDEQEAPAPDEPAG